MAKLLRQVYAVWKKDCDFDKNWESGTSQSEPEQPAAQETPQAQEKVVGHSQAQSPSRKVVTTTTSSVTKNRPAINFAELRGQIPMSEVLRLLDWQSVSKAARVTLRGPCPVHGSQSEKSSSFAANVVKNVYCCHSCDSKGNTLDLWAAVHQLSVFDAAWDLIDRLSLEAPLLERKENCSV